MADRRQPSRRIDVPEPGWFRMRLCRGGPWVGAAIIVRLGHMMGQINGESGGVDRIWTSGERISWDQWKLLDENKPPNAEQPIDVRTIKTF